MPNKNIYVRDEDLELFERAEQLSGCSLSATITSLLRDFVTEHEAMEKKMEKQVVEIGVWGARNKVMEDDRVRKISFVGALLATHRENLDGSRNGTKHRLWRAYLTGKGKALVWCKYEPQWPGDRAFAGYMVSDHGQNETMFVPEDDSCALYLIGEGVVKTPLLSTPIPEAIQLAFRKAFYERDILEIDV